VVTTEATANSHAYLVTALLGPAAFAPLAASNVVIRPINVVTNALGEWERPRMARTHQEGRLRDLEASRRSYRWTLLLFWLATLVGGTALLLLVPSNHWLPPQYDSQFLIVAAGLWMLVALARLLRAPESTVLQALGSFRPLALATIYSAPVSVLAVLLSLAFGSVLWSIAGVLVGEILCCLLVWRAHARFRHLEADRPVHPMGVARL
jgi:O-antigen/teichoic acid export membrane protein